MTHPRHFDAALEDVANSTALDLFMQQAILLQQLQNLQLQRLRLVLQQHNKSIQQVSQSDAKTQQQTINVKYLTYSDVFVLNLQLLH